MSSDSEASEEAKRPVYDVLLGLKDQERCVIAADIPGLRPYEAKAEVPCIETLQTQYCKSAREELASPAGGWVPVDCVPQPDNGTALGPLSDSGGDAYVTARLRLMRAPAQYTVPVTAQRRFEVPFLVRLEVASDRPMSFPAGIKVFALGERDVGSIETWAPNVETGLMPFPFGEAQERTVHLTKVASSPLQDATGNANANEKTEEGPSSAPDTPPSLPYRGFIELEFKSLAFSKPSYVRPRFLNFVATLPASPGRPAPLLFTFFKVPTIVICRVEQEPNALPRLWGPRTPYRCVARMSPKEFKKYAKKYVFVTGVTRKLGDADVARLMAALGVGPKNHLIQDRASSGSSHPTETDESLTRGINAALERLRELIKSIRHHYNRTGPAVVCSLATSHQHVEEMLHPLVAGTFLIWFDLDVPGDLVLTVRVPSNVHHRRITLPEASALPDILNSTHHATFLLDLTSKQCYPKEGVFPKPMPAAGNYRQNQHQHMGPSTKRARIEDLNSAAGSAAVHHTHAGAPALHHHAHAHPYAAVNGALSQGIPPGISGMIFQAPMYIPGGAHPGMMPAGAFLFQPSAQMMPPGNAGMHVAMGAPVAHNHPPTSHMNPNIPVAHAQPPPGGISMGHPAQLQGVAPQPGAAPTMPPGPLPPVWSMPAPNTAGPRPTHQQLLNAAAKAAPYQPPPDLPQNALPVAAPVAAPVVGPPAPTSVSAAPKAPPPVVRRPPSPPGWVPCASAGLQSHPATGQAQPSIQQAHLAPPPQRRNGIPCTTADLAGIYVGHLGSQPTDGHGFTGSMDGGRGQVFEDAFDVHLAALQDGGGSHGNAPQGAFGATDTESLSGRSSEDAQPNSTANKSAQDPDFPPMAS